MGSKRWTLAVVCVAMFMLLLDITIVNVALPQIAEALGAEFTELQWVVDAYALTLAAGLLTAGSLADLFGRRRVFAIGLVAFTVASLLCALATGPLFLILARGGQGVGGAIMFATALALIGQDFEGRERATAFAVVGATIGASLALGPLLGGALTTGVSWEWIFLVNIPVGIAALVIVFARLREGRDPGATGVDWVGLVSSSGAMFALVFALVRGNAEGWGSPLIVGLFAAAAALLGVFLIGEWRQRHPMLDLSLFRKPAFGGASIAAFAVSGSLIALFLYIALYFQVILGYSALETGVRFLPITVLAAFGAALSGRLSAHVPHRLLMGVGLGLVGLGLVLMHGLTRTADWTALLAGLMVAGLGTGLVNPAIASTAIGVVRSERSGMASGINNTFRQLGIATGIAGLGALFASQVEQRVVEGLAGTPLARGGRSEELAARVAEGGAARVIEGAPPQLRETVGAAVRGAFVDGLNEIFLVAAAVAFAGALLSFALVRSRDFVTSPGTEPAAI